MPLLFVPEWPSLDRVADEGITVHRDASSSGLPVLEVGLLNMMPERALTATERQFLRLLASHEEKICRVHSFHLSALPCSKEVQTHRDRYSREHVQIPESGLNALVITGANISRPNLTEEPFWNSLAESLKWAEREQVPTICSCLAAHASALLFHGIQRHPLKQKCWGIFPHQVCEPDHPLMQDLPEHFEMPHSRFNEVSAEEFEKHGVRTLAISCDAGVQIAVEPDGRRVYFQGHPEYEAISLLKEYKREVLRFFSGECSYPPLPEHTFSADAEQVAREFCTAAQAGSKGADAFPESRLAAGCRASWAGIARSLYRNWLSGLEDTL